MGRKMPETVKVVDDATGLCSGVAQKHADTVQGFQMDRKNKDNRRIGWPEVFTFAKQRIRNEILHHLKLGLLMGDSGKIC